MPQQKTIHLQFWRPRYNSWVRNFPWRRKWQLTPVFLPGDFHGLRGLASYSPRSLKESDMTEQLTEINMKEPDSGFVTYNLVSEKILKFGCCCSVAKLCPTLCNPMNCSTPGFPVLHYFLEFAQTHVHWVDDAILLSSSVVPFSCPQSFPSIRVFSSELTLHIRWSKHWSFRFSISLFSEYSRSISFRIDWLALPAVQGTLKSLLQHQCSKALI